MLAAALAVMVAVQVGSVAEVPSPRPHGWVVDQANVLAPTDETQLNALGNELKQLRDIELAVVTVDDVPGSPKAFATALFNTWGIGSAQTHNGVLVLLVMGQRRLEIETGTGMERALTSQWLADMQAREMVPHFKRGQFGIGLVTGVGAIATHLKAAPGESPSTSPTGEYRSDGTVTTPPTPDVVPPHVYTPPPAPETDRTALFGLLGGGVVLGGGGAALALRRRKKQRTCETCQPARPMLPLGEVEDDAHLDGGQKREEQVGSVDYEVLICAGCQSSRTLRHGKWFSGYGRCSSCRYKTLRSTSTTLVHATYDHGGQVEVIEDCAHCSYHHRSVRYTAARTRPSTTSSSTSSFSSSRGSSSGYSGGRSSGGGSGSSW